MNLQLFITPLPHQDLCLMCEKFDGLKTVDTICTDLTILNRSSVGTFFNWGVQNFFS